MTPSRRLGADQSPCSAGRHGESFPDVTVEVGKTQRAPETAIANLIVRPQIYKRFRAIARHGIAIIAHPNPWGRSGWEDFSVIDDIDAVEVTNVFRDVAATGVYQDAVLHPWTDLDNYVESLNRDRRVTIVREFPA